MEKHLNNPVITAIEDKIDRVIRKPKNNQANESQARTLYEQYESAMYHDTYKLLINLLGTLSSKDAWWLAGAWDEITKHEECDDAYVGKLFRLFIKRQVRSLALEQAGETLRGQ